MYTDIKIFADEIIEKTGVKFAVFDENGEFLTGSASNVDKISTDFDGIVSSSQYNATLFKMRFRSKNYIGSVAGAGKTERNYAYLISELAEKDSSKSVQLSREEFFRAVLLGEASYFQISRYASKYGLTDKSACVMIITVEKGNPKDVLDVITNYGFRLRVFPRRRPMRAGKLYRGTRRGISFEYGIRRVSRPVRIRGDGRCGERGGRRYG